MNKYEEALYNLEKLYGFDGYADKDAELLEDLIIDKLNKYKWHDLRENPEDLPTDESNSSGTYPYKEYLVFTKNDAYGTLCYCEGWNCQRNIDGSVQRDNEIKGIIKWKEIEED